VGIYFVMSLSDWLGSSYLTHTARVLNKMKIGIILVDLVFILHILHIMYFVHIVNIVHTVHIVNKVNTRDLSGINTAF
jgi:hypothetical protein